MPKNKRKKRPPARPRAAYAAKDVFDAFDDGSLDLVRKYYDRYVELGHALSREALEAMDMVDLRAICRYDATRDAAAIRALGGDHGSTWRLPSPRSFSELPEEDKMRIPALGAYALVPPFPEGSFRVNEDRWLYFKILDVSRIASEKRMSVYVRDYSQAGTIWVPGAAAEMVLHHRDDPGNRTDPCTVLAELDEATAMGPKRIVRRLTQRQLGWTDPDFRRFHALPQPGSGHDVEQLTRTFSLCAWLTSAMLDKYKPGRPERDGSASRPARAEFEAGGKTGPGRRVRSVGPVAVRSERRPRLWNKETIVRYRLSEWGRRAHVRRYKSGKTVLVQATTCHRRAVDAEGKPAGRRAPTLMVVRDEIQETKRERVAESADKW